MMKMKFKKVVALFMTVVVLAGIISVGSTDCKVQAANDYTGEYVAASKEYGTYYVVELAKVKGNKYKVQMYRYWGNGHESFTSNYNVKIKNRKAKFKCIEEWTESYDIKCQIKLSKGKMKLKCTGSSSNFTTNNYLKLKKVSKKNFVKVNDNWKQ